MLNKLVDLIHRYDMVKLGDTVICAVSGGADSMALLWSMYLLRDKLGIHLRAAHFNHQLRGTESDADELFVRQFCNRFDIPLDVGSSPVTPGEKGLEAAAREARYAFLRSLKGKIATAHTADDNAETVLLHLVRGTGLKGLGGISPVMGNVIRPMLDVTRQEVEALLEEYHISFREDSSNGSDRFLRNRLRHHVMPVLRQENPRISRNLSDMAQRLREDEQALQGMLEHADISSVPVLRQMTPALRKRALERFLKENGVREPEAEHISLAESLVFSEKPSAKAHFPGNITFYRNYDRLERTTDDHPLEKTAIPCPGMTEISGYRVYCQPAEDIINRPDVFTVVPVGEIYLRQREAGDEIRLPGGTKSLKKLFIDRKIPARQRQCIPVLADDSGIIGVYGVGTDQNRLATQLPAVQIRIECVNISND